MSGGRRVDDQHSADWLLWQDYLRLKAEYQREAEAIRATLARTSEARVEIESELNEAGKRAVRVRLLKQMDSNENGE